MTAQLGLAFVQAVLLGAVAGTVMSVVGWTALGVVMLMVVMTSLLTSDASLFGTLLGVSTTIIGYNAGLATLLALRYRLTPGRA